MDKFPARRQGNHWSNRQQASTSSTISTTSSSNHHHHHTFTPAFTTPSRVGVALPSTSSMDAMSSTAPVVSMGPPMRRPLHGFSRKGGKPAPTPSTPSQSSEADKLFKMKMVEKYAEQVLAEKLKDVAYDSTACRDMCPDVASAILNKIQDFSLKQYKLVCVVSLGSLKEKPGVQFGSRCLWNKDTDNFVSVKYSNGSVYAVALIFGLYFD